MTGEQVRADRPDLIMVAASVMIAAPGAASDLGIGVAGE